MQGATADVGPLRLKRDWIGLIVRSTREFANGYAVFPEGTLFEVIENRAGLTLKSLPCEHCGLSMLIRKIPEHRVKIIRRKS